MLDMIVAPLAGAWIEIKSGLLGLSFRVVAPLAGAWIEITGFAECSRCPSCRSPCGSVD